jgi:6-phosphogluconolactonase
MAHENLFVPAGVPEKLQFPVERCGVAPPEQVANDYEVELGQAIAQKTANGIPIFDVMLLGVGTDGHTASLFPHTAALKPPPGKVVVANYVDKLKTWRITVTGDVIRSAENLIVMVTGEDKAEAIQHVLEDELDHFIYPAQLVRDLDSATWLLDKAAATNLKSHSHT